MWTIERVEAGMGEHEYNIYRNGMYMCHTDDHQKALYIQGVMERDENTSVLSDRNWT